MDKMLLQMTVNGEPIAIKVDPGEMLVDVLRDRLGLTGAKKACGHGECGACAVILDGQVITSCITLAMKANNKGLLTIEGLAEVEGLHPIQEAFVEYGATQCGYCTPGMILSAKALLDQNPDPTEEEVRTGISGNLCRCTGYAKVVEAILGAAEAVDQAKKGR